MKVSVIICEHNPLHSGHKRLLDFARTFSDKIICVMSGNFVQRGMPAVCNKYKRATHTILAGADMVVELPTVFATASAPDFALGGVKIANALSADFLVFGSECGDISQLQRCAKLLDDPAINQAVRTEMSKGVAYPKAVATAVGQDILSTPNNTLAVEYLRAISQTNSSLVPVTLKREKNAQFASSSEIRADKTLLCRYCFPFVEKDVDVNVEEKYRTFVTQFLATVEKDKLADIADMSEGLHNRIFAADKTHGFEKMMEEIKTKRYTRTKLNRILLNCVLGITEECKIQAKTNLSQINVLAVRATQLQLLDNPLLAGNVTDPVTARADRLYSTFDGQPTKSKLIKL